jgi:hypothetical protein
VIIVKNKRKINTNRNKVCNFILRSSTNPIKKAAVANKKKWLKNFKFKNKNIIKNKIYMDKPPKHNTGCLWKDCGLEYSLSSKIFKFKFL